MSLKKQSKTSPVGPNSTQSTEKFQNVLNETHVQFLYHNFDDISQSHNRIDRQ